MKPPTVSVAIATYNRAAMVRQAIEAALSQSLAPMEVCVADDASPDETWSVLTEIAATDERVRVFRQERNTGGVENWNFAVRQTRGEYIAWCSDDDRFLPGHLEASVKFLEAHPDIGMVHSGFVDAVEAREGSKTLERSLRFQVDSRLDRESLLFYLTRYYDWPFHPSTIVLRRSVWEKVGTFNARYALADTDWFVRVVEGCPIAMLARHGVLNRRHPGNWSNRLGSARMQAEIRTIVESAIDRLLVNEPLMRSVWKRIWNGNVRLRLLLTASVRVSTGHANAACLAWDQAMAGMLPGALLRLGNRLIRRRAERRVPRFDDVRQSVSPL